VLRNKSTTKAPAPLPAARPRLLAGLDQLALDSSRAVSLTVAASRGVSGGAAPQAWASCPRHRYALSASWNHRPQATQNARTAEQ